jgi:hypothetical protein
MERKVLYALGVGVVVAVALLIGLWVVIAALTEADAPPEERKTVLLYVQRIADEEDSERRSCPPPVMESVIREVPAGSGLEDVVSLLVRDILTHEERSRGLRTAFPVSSVDLISVTIQGSTATVTFHDPLRVLAQETCAMELVKNQLEYTILAYPGIDDVVFLPAGILR